jgi:uncharacterized protein (TIGR02421 family)
VPTGGGESAALVRFAYLDAQLVEAAKPIKVLSALGWPAKHTDEFLAGWAKGNPKLPEVAHPRLDWSDRRRALGKIVLACDPRHPVGNYVGQTAASYAIAARMLEQAGKPDFRVMSELLYGVPTDCLGTMSHLSLAEDFIKITSDFGAVEASGEESGLPPEEARVVLERRAAEFFGPGVVRVEVDANLASKAAAGAERMRIRGSARFSAGELDQLVEHELFVHSATMLNGRRQPQLKSLGLGSPRTTGTQEGLATFAEMITATMDLMRLRRIALRIKAIQMGLEGADFIEVFRFFVGAGQSPRESFQSAARIFRGGDVRGKHVFTKDVVYLKGLFSVHTFLRKAIEARKLDYPQHLFIGRLALGDVMALEEHVRSGWIAPPEYLPRWVAGREGLAAYLAYSVFTNRLSLTDVELGDFVEPALTDDPALFDVSA